MILSKSDQLDQVVDQLNKNLAEVAVNITRRLSTRMALYCRQSRETFIKIPKQRQQFMVLCAAFHFIDDDFVRFQLRLRLEELTKIFGPEYEVKISLLLRSKAETICYILDSDVFGRTPNEVFGIIIRCLDIKSINCYPHNGKVKKPQRKRGYNDQHSRRLPHTIHSCYAGTLEANKEHEEIEMKRQIVKDTLALLSENDGG